MASKTLTISCPVEMIAFLEENPALSASKVFQGAIENIQNSLKHNPQLMEALKQIELLKKQKNMIDKERGYMTKFINDNNLWDKYTKEYPLSII